MADDTGTPEAGTEQTTDAPGIDLSPIEEQLRQQDQKLNSFMEQFSQQQEPEAEDDPYAGLENYYEDFGIEQEPQDDPQAALRAIARLSDERARGVFEQNVSPEIQQMRQELQSFRLERDLAQLKQELPKLNDPDTASAVADILEQNLQGLPPEARTHPNMVRLAYRAWEADQMATGEGSDARQHPSLENPAGANPDASTELTWNDRMKQGAGLGDKGQSFWGFNGL